MIEELLKAYFTGDINGLMESAIKHCEQLPSGLYFGPPKDPGGISMLIDKQGCQLLNLTQQDVARMYGLYHPEKVHGNWTGDCGGREPRQETAFEKAIKDQAEVKPEEDLKDAQSLMGDI